MILNALPYICYLHVWFPLINVSLHLISILTELFGIFFSCLLAIRFFSYILCMSPMPDVQFVKTFFHSVGYLILYLLLLSCKE